MGVFRLLRSRPARPASRYSDEDNMVACSRQRVGTVSRKWGLGLAVHLPEEAPDGQMPDPLQRQRKLPWGIIQQSRQT